MARVLLVDFEVAPSPERRSVELVNIMKALASRYDVDVLTLKSPDLPYVDRFMGTRMLRVPVGTGGLAAEVDAFRRAVRRQLEGADYDVVHFRSAWAGLPACEARGADGEAAAKLVFEPTLSPLTEPRAADPDLARALTAEEEVCLRAADRIVVPTEVARTHLAARGFTDRLCAIPPGVDVDHFDWQAVPPSSRPRVLYAGYLSGGRGLRLLLEAMAIVRAQRNAELVLVGPMDPGFEPALAAAIRAAGLESNVILQGPVDHADMARVLSTGDICVAPSAADETDRPLGPFPIKILEYMACRRAVVAPRRAIVEEVVTDGHDALLFDSGVGQALADGILRLLDDQPLRERLADAAWHTARLRFPASQVRRRVLEMYASIAAPSGSVGPAQVAPGPGLPTAPDTTTARRAAPEPEDDTKS